MWPCAAHSEGPRASRPHLLRLLLLDNLEEKRLGLEAGAMSSLSRVSALPPVPWPCTGLYPLPIAPATPLSSGGEAGPCENSPPALDPWECLPGRTGPLGSFAFLPLRFCRAQLSAGDRGQRSLRLGTTVEEAHWLQEPLRWRRRRRGWQLCPVADHR